MTYADTIRNNRPIAYYRLDESSGLVARDASGNGNDATISATGITYGLPGALVGDANTCMGFDGSSGLITPPSSLLSGATAFTVEAWSYDTGNTGTQGGVIAADHAPYYINIQYNDTSLRFQIANASGGNGQRSHNGTYLNTWLYLAASYKSDGTVTYYINGAIVDTLTIGANATVMFDEWLIGKWDGFFKGRIDEVAIYNSTLTSGQIAAHYLAGITAPPVAQTALSEIQTAIYSKLTGDTTLMGMITGVFDADVVPQNQSFPYVTMGDKATEVPDNALQTRGYEDTFTLDIWSDAQGFKECQSILDQMNRLLDQKTLVLSTHHHVGTWYETSAQLKDPDVYGIKHMPVTYRIMTQET